MREGGRIKIENISDSCIEPEHWVENDLESVACSIYPELTGIKGELLSSGALKAGMSGSGSAFFRDLCITSSPVDCNEPPHTA